MAFGLIVFVSFHNKVSTLEHSSCELTEKFDVETILSALDGMRQVEGLFYKINARLDNHSKRAVLRAKLLMDRTRALTFFIIFGVFRHIRLFVFN